MRRTIIVIPARLESRRVPRKVLMKIGGETVLNRVWRACYNASSDINADVVVGTDSIEIMKHCNEIGAMCLPTPEACSNGTERVAHVASELDYNNGDWLINVQADHVAITPDSIVEFHNKLKYGPESYHSLYCGWEKLSESDMGNDSVVKVVVSKTGEALWFTRSPISGGVRHSGIYGYTGAFLNRYLSWGVGALEQAEGLEQMRVLENGCRIKCVELEISTGHAINTENDLKAVIGL